jgi:endonuclease G, mitochondrial
MIARLPVCMLPRFLGVAVLLIVAVLPTFAAEPGYPQPCAQRIDHAAYSLCYDEAREQAAWVQYELTRDEASSEKASRKGWNFEPDDAVKTGSATRADYRNSGYDKGHLAPAGDMKWSTAAMRECFLFSNCSPQEHGFNSGVWNDLENAVRSFARKHGSVTVVTGPIFDAKPMTIGPDHVAVPSAFYKVLLFEDSQAIAFILPHESTASSYRDFAVTVDAVEAATGLDFFPALDDKTENLVEASSDPNWWFPRKR